METRNSRIKSIVFAKPLSGLRGSFYTKAALFPVMGGKCGCSRGCPSISRL